MDREVGWYIRDLGHAGGDAEHEIRLAGFDIVLVAAGGYFDAYGVRRRLHRHEALVFG